MERKRKMIDQEYIDLAQFNGYYGEDGFWLRLSYNDPEAYKCFNLKPYCSHFEIIVDYYESGEIEDVRVTYYDGVDYVGKVKKSFWYYESELQFLKEMPITYGFDEIPITCPYAHRCA